MKYDEKVLQERYRESFSGSSYSPLQIYESLSLFERYQEYFRGKHYLSFSKQDQQKLQDMDPQLTRNEYDPQDMKLSIDEYKIFEIKGLQLSGSSL